MFHPWVQSRVNNPVLQNIIKYNKKYNKNIIKYIINLHASTKSKLITDLSFSPWLCLEISIFKIRVRKL